MAKVGQEMKLAIADDGYRKWILDIESRFRRQQVKAAIHINSDKIEFYWSLGRDICEMQVERCYGEGVIDALSRDLRSRIPDAKGLTPGGLYYCKRFYLLYKQTFEIFPQVGEVFKPMHSASLDVRFPLNVFAQFCLEGYNQPIAITEYQGIQILPDNFNEALPSIDELEAEVIK